MNRLGDEICGFLIKKTKKAIQPIDRKFISREDAIDIADMENNLRYYMYLDSRENGSPYGLIEISDYYSTLVKYNGKYAWYIKVLEGRYGTKEDERFLRGYFDEYSNISCLVCADSGKFIYLGKNFDTRSIRMVTDEEFLYYINNFLQPKDFNAFKYSCFITILFLSDILRILTPLKSVDFVYYVSV